MMCLCWCEVAENLPLPDFGDVFRAHIQQKKHPRVRACSLSAWNLLAQMLRDAGCETLPRVEFAPGGKPCFADAQLHFSLSHSGSIAAVILSDAPGAVDVEMVRSDVHQKLLVRCLAPAEIAEGCDFFEAWTKKECIAKLDGRGMSAHPSGINTLDAKYTGRFFSCALRDCAGKRYALSALCENAAGLQIQKRSII